MSDHSSGPWRTGFNEADLEAILGPPFLDRRLVWRDRVIAAVVGDEVSDATRHANGQLLAAAPKLLEALKQALAESGCDGDLCMHRWHDTARAALAEARGE